MENSPVQVIATAPPADHIKLVTASGDYLPIITQVESMVSIGSHTGRHTFIVVDELIAPVILGMDFFRANKLVIDFSTNPLSVYQHQKEGPLGENNVKKVCTIGKDETDTTNEFNDCAIPVFSKEACIESPNCFHSELQTVVQKNKQLFSTFPGSTQEAHHHIVTSEPPVKIPPRRIPIHYKEEVEKQLQEMLKLGIIEESQSPWMAPAVYVPKKSGGVRICVDYRELNKRTKQDSYPLPLIDEVQDRLAGSVIFSTLDLQCGYWQMPVYPLDKEKTAFCPAPGMGLYQFCRMPFGLMNAPSSFQRMMDRIFRSLPYVSTYIDDVLIHSQSIRDHKAHLQEVFNRLKEAGLTLRGRKCNIGLTEVKYLGHIFSAKGLRPDPLKVDAIINWPTLKNAEDVRRFLGLASYYRRYVFQFSEVAAPLHNLTCKHVAFEWSPSCEVI